MLYRDDVRTRAPSQKRLAILESCRCRQPEIAVATGKPGHTRMHDVRVCHAYDQAPVRQQPSGLVLTVAQQIDETYGVGPGLRVDDLLAVPRRMLVAVFDDVFDKA